MPFRCRRCHAYGHPVSESRLPLCTINGGKRKAHLEDSKGDPKAVEITNPMSVTEGSGHERTSEDSDHFSQDSEAEPDARVVSPPAPVAEDEFSTPVEEEAPPGPSIQGTSTYSLSPSINFLLNQCTLVGLDWVEGLKNLSISGPSIFGYLPSVVDRAGASTILVDDVSEPIHELSSANTHLLEDPPNILEPNPGKGAVDPGYSSPETSESGYFLQSCNKKPGGGLGKDPVPVRKGRGRISHFSKAQSRAKNDLREGKQLSIERALRAVNARRPVRK